MTATSPNARVISAEVALKLAAGTFALWANCFRCAVKSPTAADAFPGCIPELRASDISLLPFLAIERIADMSCLNCVESPLTST